MFGGSQITDKAQVSSSNVKFGLNKGKITKLEYNANGGANNGPGDCIDITVTIKGKENRVRVYDPSTGFYTKIDKVSTLCEPNTQEFTDNIGEEITKRSKYVLHFLKALGVTEDDFNKATAGGFPTFAGWAQVVCSLKPNNFTEVDVDAFLQYQWNIKGDNKMTYLEFAKDLDQGLLCVKSDGKKYSEVIVDNAITYVAEDGTIHPFTRTEWFMESNWANPQKEEDETKEDSVAPSPTASSAPWG